MRLPGESNAGRCERSHRRVQEQQQREMIRATNTGRPTVPARYVVAIVTAAVAALSTATPASSVAASRPAIARSARVLTVHDEGHLHFVRSSGSLLVDEGRVTGSFPGPVKVRFVYNGEPNVTAYFTISGAGGSISAKGEAKLSSPTSPDPSFKGHMQIMSGTGRYAHIHGDGELFGVFNRRSYALTVQALGKLPY